MKAAKRLLEAIVMKLDHGYVCRECRVYQSVAERALLEHRAECPAGALQQVFNEEPGDQQLRAAAVRVFQRDGEIEIDDDAIVSRGEDPGAYVQAWVWVSYKDAGIAPAE